MFKAVTLFSRTKMKKGFLFEDVARSALTLILISILFPSNVPTQKDMRKRFQISIDLFR